MVLNDIAIGLCYLDKAVLVNNIKLVIMLSLIYGNTLIPVILNMVYEKFDTFMRLTEN